jgi:mercuric ion transport protein
VDDRKEQSRLRVGLAASVIAAVGASICCIGPIAAAFLGFTSLAALVKYEPLRPAFTLITLLFLGSAFYLAYRKRPIEGCEPGSVCAAHGPARVRQINVIVLWIVAAVVLTILTFPTWSNWVLG